MTRHRNGHGEAVPFVAVGEVLCRWLSGGGRYYYGEVGALNGLLYTFCSVLEFGPDPTPPTPLFQGAPVRLFAPKGVPPLDQCATLSMVLL